MRYRLVIIIWFISACGSETERVVDNLESENIRFGELADREMADICEIVDLGVCDDNLPFVSTKEECGDVLALMKTHEPKRLTAPFVECWAESSCGPLLGTCSPDCHTYPSDACDRVGCEAELGRPYDDTKKCYLEPERLFCGSKLRNCTNSYPAFLKSPGGTEYLREHFCGAPPGWTEDVNRANGREICSMPNPCELLGSADCTNRTDCVTFELREYYTPEGCLGESWERCVPVSSECLNEEPATASSGDSCYLSSNGCVPDGYDRTTIARCDDVKSKPECNP